MVRTTPLAIIISAVLALAVLVYAGYSFWQLSLLHDKTTHELSLTKTDLGTVSERLTQAQEENKDLVESLEAERNRNNDLQDEVQQLSQSVSAITGTVGTLQKLSKTDPELLQKYSRVYFLSENYVPADLAEIKQEFVRNPQEQERLILPAIWFLYRMVQAAQEEGVTLQVASAYRSFGEQSSLKASYRFTYGAAANTFSADRGYSEHQLGTTVDLASPEQAVVFENFEKTAAYAWLTQKAYRFGFVLSYPENNSYYQFEPWHWRFVGIALATKLHEEGKYFYDLPQREIDEYLVSIFDDKAPLP